MEDKIFIAIQNTFRNVGTLSSDDCEYLRALISTSSDISILESAMYIFGRSCNLGSVIERYRHFAFEEQEPGLTAVCLRSLDFSGHLREEDITTIECFIDAELYDFWYDEVLFSLTYYFGLEGGPLKIRLAPRVLDLEKRAGELQIHNLLNFIENIRNQRA